MAVSLDEIDVRLLKELQTDADRPNVELARIVGLSPAATLNRVRRMKEAGVIRHIAARLDSATAGFALQVYLLVTLARHDEAAERRFARGGRRARQHHLGRQRRGRDRRDPDARRPRRGRAARHALAPVHARGRAAADHAAAAGRAQAFIAAAAACDIRPQPTLSLNTGNAVTMTQTMEIQAANSPALMIQANSLDAVRSTLAAAQSATTPAAARRRDPPTLDRRHSN